MKAKETPDVLRGPRSTPALLAIGLALVVIGLACSTDPVPATPTPPVPPVTSPALPPEAPPTLVVRAAEVLNVSLPSTSTPTPTPCPEGSAATKKVVLQDLGGTGAYVFSPNGLTFSAGDCVEITIEAETEFHTFTVEELGIDQSADGGETVTFTFTFAEAGEFGLICVPHESLGMVGTITVQ